MKKMCHKSKSKDRKKKTGNKWRQKENKTQEEKL